VADALPARLNSVTARLIGRLVLPEDRFALAVSGGADSMAMLSAAALCWPGQVEAATVDHGLRSEAAQEAAMVADWCTGHAIPHAILRPDQPLAGNLQSAGREARYRLLAGWQAARGLHWLLTAHQADDQIETVMLRLSRGAGVGGLASVRARRDVILRPLLAERRATLRDWCSEQAVPFVDDPSNVDARFDRARLRQTLAGIDPIDPVGLARSVEALGEADAALDWMTDALESAHVRVEGEALILDRTDLPRDILRRLLLRMIARAHPSADKPRGPSLDQALVQLFDAKSVALADCIVAGGPVWTVRRAPPRRTG